LESELVSDFFKPRMLNLVLVPKGWKFGIWSNGHLVFKVRNWF